MYSASPNPKCRQWDQHHVSCYNAHGSHLRPSWESVQNISKSVIHYTRVPVTVIFSFLKSPCNLRVHLLEPLWLTPPNLFFFNFYRVQKIESTGSSMTPVIFQFLFFPSSFIQTFYFISQGKLSVNSTSMDSPWGIKKNSVCVCVCLCVRG